MSEHPENRIQDANEGLPAGSNLANTRGGTDSTDDRNIGPRRSGRFQQQTEQTDNEARDSDGGPARTKVTKPRTNQPISRPQKRTPGTSGLSESDSNAESNVASNRRTRKSGVSTRLQARDHGQNDSNSNAVALAPGPDLPHPHPHSPTAAAQHSGRANLNEQPVLREVVVEVPVRGDQVLDAHGVRHEQVGQHQARAEHGPRGEHEMNAIDVDAADQQRERYERRIRRNKEKEADERKAREESESLQRKVLAMPNANLKIKRSIRDQKKYEHLAADAKMTWLRSELEKATIEKQKTEEELKEARAEVRDAVNVLEAAFRSLDKVLPREDGAEYEVALNCSSDVDIPNTTENDDSDSDSESLTYVTDDGRHPVDGVDPDEVRDLRHARAQLASVRGGSRGGKQSAASSSRAEMPDGSGGSGSGHKGAASGSQSARGRRARASTSRAERERGADVMHVDELHN